jgi:hypothetical protein
MADVYYETWFIFSYDADEELYENTDDFRKDIIKILRERKVFEMHEFVETTIHFLDPLKDLDMEDKLELWYDRFREISDDFKFVIAPLLEDGYGNPLMMYEKNVDLDDGFQDLRDEIIAEEKKVKLRRFIRRTIR